MAGRKKGGRMIAEIQRLKSMGLGKRAIARTLKISRNTLRKYWDPVPEKASGEDRRTYRPEWSEQIDWSSVKQAVENGQALAHYWEDFIAALPACGGSPQADSLYHLLAGVSTTLSDGPAPVRTGLRAGELLRDRLQGIAARIWLYRSDHAAVCPMRALWCHVAI